MKHRNFYLIGMLWLIDVCNSLVIFMAARKGKKGILKKELIAPDEPGGVVSPRSVNRGKGQEVTGVSLPATDTLKGWEFGNKVRLVCANVKGKYYALQGECPRCAFDLFKGTLIIDDPGFDDLPRVACPTCSTTYSLSNGKHGPPLTRQGLAGFVGGLAMTATMNAANTDAKAFLISRDDDGRIYCRERK